MLTADPTPEEAAVLDRHISYLQDLTAAGVVILAGRTLNSDPSSFGIVVFKAADLAVAERIMQNDPAVSAGVMQAKLYPYRVALMGGR
ncbi:MAG: hypothetical protein ISR91_03265 [Candidatus Delongbacteria bacterium]|nr:hypothetical protein [Candidatus Delongbacteria bacterium]